VTKKKVGIFFVLSGFLILSVVFAWFFMVENKTAALAVDTFPASQIYINGILQGRTPFEKEIGAGEIVLKAIPDAFEKPLIPYEVKIKLASGVKTIVRREIGETEEDSAGEIISFEKVSGKKSNLAVVSNPDAVEVFLDQSLKDTTPLKITDLEPRIYELIIKTEGYKERKFSIQPVAGYDLTVIAKLARDRNIDIKKPEISSEDLKQDAEIEQKEIKILNTPTGFLRVRSNPSTNSEEIGRVSPGKSYKYIEKNAENSWYKIEYEEGKEGWVSDEYATTSANEAN
jgi:hypothetical protein